MGGMTAPRNFTACLDGWSEAEMGPWAISAETDLVSTVAVGLVTVSS